jgi:hypothetical protein
MQERAPCQRLPTPPGVRLCRLSRQSNPSQVFNFLVQKAFWSACNPSKQHSSICREQWRRPKQKQRPRIQTSLATSWPAGAAAEMSDGQDAVEETVAGEPGNINEREFF